MHGVAYFHGKWVRALLGLSPGTALNLGQFETHQNNSDI